MNVGQVVKFREVVEAGDDACRFIVSELGGDRVLVTEFAVCHEMSILPQYVYPTADLVAAE